MKEIELIKDNIEEYLENTELEELIEHYDTGIDATDMALNIVYDAIINGDKKDLLSEEDWKKLLTALIQDSYTVGATCLILTMAGYDFETEWEEIDE